MRFFPACLAFLLLAFPASGQQASKIKLEGKTEIVKVERIIRVFDDRVSLIDFPLTLTVPAGAVRPSWTVPAGVTYVRKGSAIEITAAPKGELKVFADWGLFNKDKLEFTEDSETITILIGGSSPVVPDPPKPPTPEPKPPQPVTSFRVIFVAESSKTLTKEQNSVIAGKSVRDWLTANTTPEAAFAGWRHYDPQRTVANESPNMKALWEAVQPKLSGLPCVVVEVNGHAEIIPLAATPAEMVATFEAYRKGGK